MIHLQQSVSNWLEAVTRLPAGSLVKSVTVQQLAEAKAANSGIRTFLRYVNDGLQQVNPDDTEAVRENRARAWFNAHIDGTFLDGVTAGIPHWQATDIVGWWNEYYAGSQTAEEKALWWKQERTAARVWRDEYRNGPQAAKLGHIRLALPAAAVGNDIPLQSAQTAVQYDCVLDYHAYDKYFDGGVRDPLSWQYHCGRWQGMDIQFRNAGYTCQWLFGEAGPYGSAVTGWRHETIFGGDVGRYVEAVRTWIREIKLTHAYQTGRVLGFALFTTGGGTLWEWFETRQPELNALADMLRQEWTQQPPPDPPPPDPTPDPCQPRLAYQREYWAVPQDATPDQFATLSRLAHANRRTIGFSYDDAMFGPNLISRKAVLFGIPANQQPAFTAFRDEHYPGAVIEFQPMPIVLGLPLLNGSITVGSRFNDPRPYGNGLHEGQDFPAVLGRNVYASYAGVVEFIGQGSNYGIYVRLRHEPSPSDIWLTYYCHLSEELVSVGQVVSKGELIGKVGSTGFSDGNHLHFNLVHVGYGLDGYVVDDVVDPLPYLGLS